MSGKGLGAYNKGDCRKVKKVTYKIIKLHTPDLQSKYPIPDLTSKYHITSLLNSIHHVYNLNRIHHCMG